MTSLIDNNSRGIMRIGIGYNDNSNMIKITIISDLVLYYLIVIVTLSPKYTPFYAIANRVEQAQAAPIGTA